MVHPSKRQQSARKIVVMVNEMVVDGALCALCLARLHCSSSLTLCTRWYWPPGYPHEVCLCGWVVAPNTGSSGLGSHEHELLHGGSSWSVVKYNPKGGKGTGVLCL